jgi:hypothetical protein
MIQPTSKEEWRSVVGFEGRYEVSSLGQVRGVGPRSRGIKTSGPSSDGYYRQVCLYVSAKKTKSVLIHTLVAEAFIGPRPAGLFCCHNDGDGWHNEVSNLRYGTPKSNSEDMVRHGNSLPGSKNAQAKLNENVVSQIKCRRGTSYRDLAVEYGVSFATIQKIMSGEGWKHVA